MNTMTKTEYKAWFEKHYSWISEGNEPTPSDFGNPEDYAQYRDDLSTYRNVTAPSSTETELAAEVERLTAFFEKAKAHFDMLGRFSRDGVKDVSHSPKRTKWQIIFDEANAGVRACDAALAQQKQEGGE